jgi:hypothetical protein
MIYPTENEYPDVGDRQAHMLFMITKLYEGVTQEVLKGKHTADEIYANSESLRNILEGSH